MDTPTLTGPIATIVAALTAGGVAYLATVLSKEQKTSEFRQSWIDALREDISEFVGVTEIIYAMMRIQAERNGVGAAVDYALGSEKKLSELAVIYYRIRLRLNRDKHGDLLQTLKRVYELFSGTETVLDLPTFNSMIQTVDKDSAAVLKREWKRVKRGEPTFLISKYLSLATLLCACALLSGIYLGHITLSWVP